MNPFRRLFHRSEKIRKQVYQLTESDLQLSPVWEFCLDEEGQPGQDETTVKPKPDVAKIYKLDGSHIAKTEFTFADGKKAVGYVYASSEEELPAIQPVIITPRGQVMFWYGIVPPQKDRQTEALAKLGLVSESLFPIRFSCVVPTDDIPLDGELEGFYHYDSDRDVQVIRV
jgi:hypothetical protein